MGHLWHFRQKHRIILKASATFLVKSFQDDQFTLNTKLELNSSEVEILLFSMETRFSLRDDLYWKECIALTPRLSSLASLLKPKCIIEKTIENFNSYPVFKRTYPWKKSWLQYVEKRHLSMPNFIFNNCLSKFWFSHFVEQKIGFMSQCVIRLKMNVFTYIVCI